MAGVYKQKECKQCGEVHRKRGPFCSQACSNSFREVGIKTKLLHSHNAKEWKKTPEGVASTKKFARDIETHKKNEERRANGEYVLQEDDWYVLPPSDYDDDGIEL
jgi:hypothetical protein